MPRSSAAKAAVICSILADRLKAVPFKAILIGVFFEIVKQQKTQRLCALAVKGFFRALRDLRGEKPSCACQCNAILAASGRQSGESGMQQKLTVAFGAQDWGVDDLDPSASELLHRMHNFVGR